MRKGGSEKKNELEKKEARKNRIRKGGSEKKIK